MCVGDATLDKQFAVVCYLVVVYSPKLFVYRAYGIFSLWFLVIINGLPVKTYWF